MAKDVVDDILADSVLPREERFSEAARDEFRQLDDDGATNDDGVAVSQEEGQESIVHPVAPREQASSSKPHRPLLQPHIRVHWEGYLQKRSDWLKHWKTYYFVLKGRTLTCYPSEQDAQRYPGTGKIKDGAFSFSDKVLIKKVNDIPSTALFDPSVPPPQISKMQTTGFVLKKRQQQQQHYPNQQQHLQQQQQRESLSSTSESSGVSSPASSSTPPASVTGHRFSIEIQNNKRLHFQAPNEATKQVWIHLASDAIRDILDSGEVKKSAAQLSVGLDDFYAAYQFFLASLCQINDNSSSGATSPSSTSGLGKLRKSASHIGSGFAMPGAAILPKVDRIISRLFTILHPDVVLRSNYLPMVPFSGTYRGHYGILEYFTVLAHTMRFTSFHVEDMSMDGRLAVVSGVEALQVRTSGRPFTQQWVHKLHFVDDGRISRIEVNGDVVASSVIFKPQGSAATLTLPPLSENVRESLLGLEQSQIAIRILHVEGSKLPSGTSYFLKCTFGHETAKTRAIPWSETMRYDETIQLCLGYVSIDDTLHVHVEMCRAEADECVMANTTVNVAYFLNRPQPQAIQQTYVLSHCTESFVGKVCLDVQVSMLPSMLPSTSSSSFSSSVLSQRHRTNRTPRGSRRVRTSRHSTGTPTIADSAQNFQPSFYEPSDTSDSPKVLKKVIIADTVFDLDPKYEVIEVVGKGTYGVVVAASDSVNGGTYAVKKITNFMRHPKLASSTLREIKLMRQLGDHPCIMGIHELQKPESFQAFEDLYIIQPLMETDLCRVIHSKEHLSDDHIQYFLYQMLCACQYMHSAGVLHRDLKPANVLVNSDCSIRVCDLGLARHVKEHSSSSSTTTTTTTELDQALSEYVVTRWYRAPELLLANVYEKSIDMWSIGCIFAEMLGRRVMFPGRSYVNQLKLIIEIVGTPETFSFCDNPSARRFAGRQFLTQGRRYRKVLWSDTFPTANPDALDLLDKLLQFDPRNRITAAAALEHPYFSQWRDEELELVRDTLTEETNFDYKEVSASNLQQLLYDEVCV